MQDSDIDIVVHHVFIHPFCRVGNGGWLTVKQMKKSINKSRLSFQCQSSAHQNRSTCNAWVRDTTPALSRAEHLQPHVQNLNNFRQALRILLKTHVEKSLLRRSTWHTLREIWHKNKVHDEITLGQSYVYDRKSVRWKILCWVAAEIKWTEMEKREISNVN